MCTFLDRESMYKIVKSKLNNSIQIAHNINSGWVVRNYSMTNNVTYFYQPFHLLFFVVIEESLGWGSLIRAMGLVNGEIPFLDFNTKNPILFRFLVTGYK